MLDFERVLPDTRHKSGPRPTGRIIREQNNRKSIILSRPWYPVAVNLNALVALRRSSWPFVDKSFSFLSFFVCFKQVRFCNRKAGKQTMNSSQGSRG